MTAWPPRTTSFQSRHGFSCTGEDFAGGNFGDGSRVQTPYFWPRSTCARFALSAYCNRTLGNVITSTAAAPKLQIWSDPLLWKLRFPANRTPRFIAAVTLDVSEYLAAFVLQRPSWSAVRLHLYSQTAEISQRTHSVSIRPRTPDITKCNVRGRPSRGPDPVSSSEAK